MQNPIKLLTIMVALFCIGPLSADTSSYLWLQETEETVALCDYIQPPSGFIRQDAAENSFASWLRKLPINRAQKKVHLYNGDLKGNQSAHYAIVQLDVGPGNLQQCADAVMRLRAEYLYSIGKYEQISFNFTNGFSCMYDTWRRGYRVSVNGNSVQWIKEKTADNSYRTFRKYLDTIFTYAGSYSLQKEMQSIEPGEKPQGGDVYIQGGFPGHAVIILDVATKPDGQKLMLLGQSYMPAQDFHILKNPQNEALSPWYPCSSPQTLITPEWTFSQKDLHKFKDEN